MKFKTTKISSEGLGGDSAKFCISEKFPVVCYLWIHQFQGVACSLE